MSRSMKKSFYISRKLLQKVRKAIEAKTRNSYLRVRTRDRSSTVVPEMIGLTLEVYNGKAYIPVLVTEDMANYRHKLGEFAPTRKFGGHSGGKAAGKK